MATESQSDQRQPNLFRHLYPPVLAHPIQTAIREAFCERWDQFMDLCEEGYVLGTRSSFDSRNFRLKYEPIRKEWHELLGWVIQIPDDLNGELDRWSSEAAGRDMSYDLALVRAVLSDLGYSNPGQLAYSIRRRRGRPGTRRQDAIEALELHLTDPKRWTWGKLAPRFCRCKEAERAKKEHDFRCQDGLEAEVRHLKRFLKRLHIPLPQ